jgi:hypothetical protein
MDSKSGIDRLRKKLKRPPGLKPAFILEFYAALKRRSSTSLPALRFF